MLKVLGVWTLMLLLISCDGFTIDKERFTLATPSGGPIESLDEIHFCALDEQTFVSFSVAPQSVLPDDVLVEDFRAQVTFRAEASGEGPAMLGVTKLSALLEAPGVMVTGEQPDFSQPQLIQLTTSLGRRWFETREPLYIFTLSDPPCA